MAAPLPPQSEERAIEALLTHQRFGEALARAQQWATRTPRLAAPYSAIARASIPLGRLDTALGAIQRGLNIAPTDPPLQLMMGVVENRLGRSDAAIVRLSALLARHPANEVDVGIALAEALHRAGRKAEVAALIAKGGAWIADERARVFTGRMLALTDPAAAIVELEDAARTTRITHLKRIAGMEAVRLLDAQQRYREAFDLACYLHRETTPMFDVGALEDAARIQGVELEKSRAGVRAPGIHAEATAFVVGMPRSGTTLLEQMLDRHPQISGIGEYEGVSNLGEGLIALGVWPQGVRNLQKADAQRLAADYLAGSVARKREGADLTFDKTLHAWRLLPALAAVLPGAAFVHIQRDARDTAISMFLSNFHPLSWGFTRDLSMIRRVIALERKLVPRALEVLALRGVSIVYEDLVDHPQREITRALECIGVAFDETVLSPQSNTRTVLTLSSEQVRKPINRSSIGRWKNYAFAFDASWDELK